MKRRFCFRTLAALALVAASGLGAEPFPPNVPPRHDGHWCATGEATQERITSIDRWVHARDQRLEKSGKAIVSSASSRIENDIILLDTTPASLPFHHTFDLEGRTVTFDPDGSESFRVRTTILDYDSDVGAPLHTFENTGAAGWHYRVVDLAAFEFPLGGESHSRLYVTAQNAIHFDTPPLGGVDQFSLLEALGLDAPIVAPLLHTDQSVIFPIPEVFVKQSPDAITITWRSGPSEWGFGLDIQARLEPSGRIVFSYKAVDEFDWGTVLVTTGSESWRTDRQRVYSQGIPAPGQHGTVQQMLDLRSAVIDRIGNSGMLELTLTVTARLRQESIAGDRYLGYYVELTNASGDGDWIMLYVTRDQVQYRTPDRGWSDDSPAAEIDGNTIRMRVFQDTLNLTSPFTSFAVTTLAADNEPSVDMMTGNFQLGTWSREFGSDLSEISSISTVSAPVVEPFTLGALNPNAVWSQLKTSYGFTDDQIDGVAIFQDFYTDLILYAGAYSTVGNPGADGVSNRSRYGTQFARSPALLHMNRVGYRWNADLPRSWHVTSHEFGHRWLYFINFDKGTGSSSALQPLGGHPAQYVHTPSAFTVYTERDSSTMGGANFFDHGDGTFSTPGEYGYFGYSWHDLYLMGLAAPEEVEDWYLIQNTSPSLGGAYYPPPGMTVSGARQEVAVEHVVRAMGPRNPTTATSQKRFRVVYVLLSVPGSEPSPETIQALNEQRVWFERTFKVATGHRAAVTTKLVPVRRRGVRLP